MNKLKIIIALLVSAVALTAQNVSIQVSGSGLIPVSGPFVTKPALISPTDWSTFNGKASATAPIPFTRITLVPVATALTNGILPSADWIRFNKAANAPALTNVEVYDGVAPGIGIINGVNKVFTLPSTPVGIPLVFLNGIKQSSQGPFAVYTQVGKVITWTGVNVPTAGMTMAVNYWK